MFICSPEQQAKKRINKLNNLKNLVETIEEKMVVPCTLLCCPNCVNQTNPEPVKEITPPPQPTASSPPDVMVCYKYEKIEKKKNCKRSNQPQRVTRSKSRELRAGILYRGCDCESRNGLQDDCRRTECHGAPECLTKPDPICGPSEFCNGKHLGLIYDIEKKYRKIENKSDECDDSNGKTVVYYNCYPATVKC